MRFIPSLFLAALVFNACGGVPGQSASEDPAIDQAPVGESLRGDPTPAYQDVEESFTNEDDQNRWFELKRALVQGFDDVCGDTFCEGDYANLQSLSFRCSVSTRTGQLKSCLWLFAGSYETVTASTGNVRPVAKFFPCKIPVQGTPAALLNSLLAPSTGNNDGPIRQPLPGGTQSTYDALGGCL